MLFGLIYRHEGWYKIIPYFIVKDSLILNKAQFECHPVNLCDFLEGRKLGFRLLQIQDIYSFFLKNFVIFLVG